MVKPDEQELLDTLRANSEQLPNSTLVEAVANQIGIHPKRLEYLLHKWADRREWNYGVHVLCGWLEPAAWLKP